MRSGNQAFAAVASCLLLAVVAAPPAVGREARADPPAADLAITDLRTEDAREPLRLDELRPRLSWILESSTRGQAQTARLQVTTSRDLLRADRPDVWDSGKV